MSARLVLPHAAWAAMAPILAAIQSRAGRPPARSARMFTEAASLARTGCPGATCQPLVGPGTQSTIAFVAGKHTVFGASSGNASRRRMAMMPCTS
jgi:hypothetical protein